MNTVVRLSTSNMSNRGYQPLLQKATPVTSIIQGDADEVGVFDDPDNAIEDTNRSPLEC